MGARNAEPIAPSVLSVARTLPIGQHAAEGVRRLGQRLEPKRTPDPPLVGSQYAYIRHTVMVTHRCILGVRRQRFGAWGGGGTSIGVACARMRQIALATIAFSLGSAVLGLPATLNAAHSSPSAASPKAPAVLSLDTGDAVLAAVGDMACDPSDSRFNSGAGTSIACAESRTSNAVVADTTVGGVLGLGDYQYDCGDASDYAVSYNPTWGRVDSIMNPVAGNHEYKTGTDAFGATCPTTNTTAQNFFSHFGTSAHPETNGHFSFDVGSWHIVGLNGNCSKSGVGGCSATSAQTKWLNADLASTLQPCILSFWHQPLFTGSTGVRGAMYKPWWDVLYAAHADVVLNGHLHNYQRYLPMNPSGQPDQPNGITEYVAGTGGEALVAVNPGAVPQPAASRKTFGYLRLTLHPAGWDSEFIDSTGQIIDASSGACHPQ